MGNNGRIPAPREILDTVRAQNLAALPPRLVVSTHLSLVEGAYPAGAVLKLVDRTIEIREPSLAVFVDEMPGANFGHPCRYRFHSPVDGHLIREVEALFPPDVTEPGIAVDHFHAPLAVDPGRPRVFAPIDLGKLRPWPWLRADDNRFALLFTSQISNRRHVEDLELGWRILVNRYGFPEDHVYVLCYDGTIGATDAAAAGMATWIGDGTPYQMHITDSATKAHLQSTLATISGRMNADSLLFIHTNDHGAPSGLCIDSSTVVTPVEWATMLDGMASFGTLVVTMEQCFSGAFEQPTLDHSRAAKTSFASAVPADKPSAGATHFDPWALAWLESINGTTAYGAPLPHDPDASGNGRISAQEAFAYSDAYEFDPAGYDDPQYGDKPVGCGSGIYFSRPPSLLDLLRELTRRYREIEVHVPPLPDPPEWSGELLKALAMAETLEARLNALTPRHVEPGRPEPGHPERPIPIPR